MQEFPLKMKSWKYEICSIKLCKKMSVKMQLYLTSMNKSWFYSEKIQKYLQRIFIYFSVFFVFFSLSAFLFNLRHGMRILLSINWTALANVVALSNKRMEEKHHCPLIRIEGKKNVIALNNKRMEKKRHCPLIRIEERKTALY